MKCPGCGGELPANSRFCNHCGAKLSDQGQMAFPSTVTGLAPNVAALLAYVLGWVSGLVMYFVEKDPFIRFHAMQSVFFFGGMHVALQALKLVIALLPFHFVLASAVLIVYAGIGIVCFVLWIILMVKAYHGIRYKLPIFGDFAERVVLESK